MTMMVGRLHLAFKNEAKTFPGKKKKRGNGLSGRQKRERKQRRDFKGGKPLLNKSQNLENVIRLGGKRKDEKGKRGGDWRAGPEIIKPDKLGHRGVIQKGGSW